MSDTLKAKLLEIINDWDEMADPDFKGDGDALFKAKYGRGTCDLIDVLRETIEESN